MIKTGVIGGLDLPEKAEHSRVINIMQSLLKGMLVPTSKVVLLLHKQF